MLKVCDTKRCAVCRALAIDLVTELALTGKVTTMPAPHTITIGPPPQKRTLGYLAMTGH